MNDVFTPPRPVRLRTALALWWPLGLVTGTVWLLLTCVGGALLAVDDFRLPTHDVALDEHGLVALNGATLESVAPTSTHWGSDVLLRVQYHFTLTGDHERTGAGYVFASKLRGKDQPGAMVGVEYLQSEPSVNRLRGGVVAMSTIWMPVLGGYVWLPLLLVFGIWFTRCWRLYGRLRFGPHAPARLVAHQRLGYINPPQLRVQYEFHGPGGTQAGSHLLRASSPLAQRVLALSTGAEIPAAVAVYDEHAPQKNRLLARESLTEGAR